AAPTKLRKGQYAALICDNDVALHSTGGEWMKPESYAKYHIVGQIFRVKSAAGTQVEIDRPIRLDYFSKERRPRLRPLEVIERAGVEDLHIWANKNIGYLFMVSKAADCWIRRCHTEFPLNAHVKVSLSHGITVRDNLMHHAYGYGGGGQGYGVWLGHWSTDCLVENNVFYHLRHAMLTTLGANGNVFGYNTSHECKLNCDISMHGFYSYMNLFEGNTVVNVDYSDYWGPVGPYNTCYRNRVTSGGIQMKNHTHRANIIANTMLGKKISVQPTCKEAHLEKNVSRSSPLSEWKIPASLYLKEKPAFWGERPWPGIGADVDVRALRAGKALQPTPADERFEEFMAGGKAKK
ncbi:hypothetical protein ACFL01_03620, partial [Planctomycetota bacterium]